jgi:hypothetical protein
MERGMGSEREKEGKRTLLVHTSFVFVFTVVFADNETAPPPTSLILSTLGELEIPP